MIKHKQVSAISDTPDASLVQPSDWNDSHAYGAGAMVLVGWAKFQVAPGIGEYPDGIPFYVTSSFARVAAGHWKFTADKTVFETASVLAGHQITYYPTMTATPRGSLTAGYYFSVYADGSDIHVELFNSSDAYVDPNLRVDITVMLIARVTAV